MHALTLLKADHRSVEKLFKEAQKTESKSRKQQLVKKVITELSVHAAIEEQVFYPAVRDAIADAEDEVLEALEEHHIIKWVLSELEKMTPDDERFDAKVKVLSEVVAHHIEEEEGEMFDTVRQHLDRRALNELGAALEAARKVAPKHPHPRAPDTPPGNFVAGLGAGLVDRARDAMRDLVKATSRRAGARTPRRGAATRARAQRAGAKSTRATAR